MTACLHAGPGGGADCVARTNRALSDYLDGPGHALYLPYVRAVRARWDEIAAEGREAA